MQKTVGEESQIRLAETLSDGTIKCAGCLNKIPIAAPFHIASQAKSLPESIRGGNLCAECAASKWKQPVADRPKLLYRDKYLEIVKRFASDIAFYAKYLASSDNFRIKADYARIYLDTLDERTQTIAGFFDNTIGGYSAAGAHHDSAMYAEDAVIRTYGIIKSLKNARDELIVANGIKVLPQDNLIMTRLANFASDLAISAFRLQMLAASENYSVSGAVKLGNILLLASADSFEKLLLDEHVRELATEENIDTLHTMVHSMETVPGGLNSMSSIVLKSAVELASRMLVRLDTSDYGRGAAALYLKMASVFEILGVRNMEMQCYAIAADKNLRRGNRRLMLAEESMKEKPGSSLWGDDLIPPNRYNALVYAMRAKEYILDAKKIWDEKLRDTAAQGSSSVMVDFDALLAKCENIADAATGKSKVRILRSDEE